jgi:hypothetical protein
MVATFSFRQKVNPAIGATGRQGMTLGVHPLAISNLQSGLLTIARPPDTYALAEEELRLREVYNSRRSQGVVHDSVVLRQLRSIRS